MRAHAKRAKLLALVVAVLASGLSGCHSGDSPAADGPLSSGDGPHDPIPERCRLHALWRASDRRTYGIHQLRQHHRDPGPSRTVASA